MKEKRGLFNVSVLVLAAFVVGFGLTPYAMAHSISNINMTPSSPAGLLNNEHVDITFDYTTDEVGGVRIWVMPYTDGSWSPNLAVSGSPLYSPPSGSGSGYVTITSGDIVVDQIRVYMMDADGNVLLWETFIDVEYHFGNSITNINMVPASPAQLMTGQNINITFDCATEELSGALVFARPYTNGLLTPGYGASGGFFFTGIDSGSQWFFISTDNQRIDQIHFEMYNNDQSVLLLEFFVDVDYHICDSGSCTWYVDADAVGTGTGHTWGNAFNELQDALAVAWPGEEIRVAEGTYKPDHGGGQTLGDREATFELIDDVVIEGGYAGFGEADPDARDTEAYETILSGDLKGNDGPDFTNNADNSYHVVSAAITGGGAVLNGFTITAGNAVGLNPTGQGGGIYIFSGSPVLINCTFIRNKAVRGGGASNSRYASDDPSFISCKFLGNSAGTGGAMESQGGEPSLTSCVLSGNVSTGSGGGLFNMGESNATMTNCTLSNNSADGSGGGVYCSWATAGITVLNCILWGNSDSGGSGESAQIRIGVGPPVVAVDFSCIEGLTGGLGGVGNIGDDPLFVDADGADDVVGTEDDDVHLLEDSPCIDAGHPAVQYQDIDGSRNDMGAYGGPFGEITEPAVYTGTGFIITNIGELPTTEIGRDTNDPNVGLAYVDPNASALFGVPQYKDSPFGHTIRVRGQFGPYDDVDFYQIMLAKWDDGNEPNSGDYVVLDDVLGAQVLGKVRWYVDANDDWQYEYVRMGPKTIDGRDYLYQFNRPLDESIWSNPDLRIRWDTRACENGLYTLTYKAYRWADPCETTLADVNLPPTDGWDHLILHIDNNPVTATIHSVKYDPCSPYYDDPCDGEIEECAIIHLTDPNENLRFTITAKHPTGFLRKWVLDALYGKNKNAGVIASENYTPVSPPYWDGVQEQEFQSEDAASLDPWQICAYQFRLRTWARTTNGTNYIYYDIFSDHYYLDFGGSTCLRADIDGSGTVDFKDLAKLAMHWLATCGS